MFLVAKQISNGSSSVGTNLDGALIAGVASRPYQHRQEQGDHHVVAEEVLQRGGRRPE